VLMRPERANRGYNPKYNKDTYLGLQGASFSFGNSLTSTAIASSANHDGIKKLNSPEDQSSQKLADRTTVTALTSVFTTSAERGLASTVQTLKTPGSKVSSSLCGQKRSMPEGTR